MKNTGQKPVTQEDAFHFIIRFLSGKEPVIQYYESRNPVYDLDVRDVIRKYQISVDGVPPAEIDNDSTRGKAISASFFDAAWELCQRGVLRPGVKDGNHQSNIRASDYGVGFSLTPYGHKWLQHSEHWEYYPAAGSRFEAQLEGFVPRFGDGYRERYREALACYQANCFLGCCAMCGAASESILLRLAVAKGGDEAAVLKRYLKGDGRNEVTKIVLRDASSYLKRLFDGYLELLKYWRDNSAHGRACGIGEAEAFWALGVLLRMAQAADSNWDQLTT